MIDNDAYLDFFSKEYLTDYLPKGGVTTKFVVPPLNEELNFIETITSKAHSNGYAVAQIDSATSKVQMIEQIFFGIARQIDWQKLANSFARLAAHSAGYPVPNDDQDLSLAMLAFTYEAIRKIHGTAYSWDPPQVTGLERLSSNRMRQYVRAWINEWDLIRLDPNFIPETTVTAVEIEYGEDDDLTQSPLFEGVENS